MHNEELQAMTVVQLRKLAKEYGVKLGAGIDKAGIVERLTEALSDAPAPAPAAAEEPQPAAAPAEKTLNELHEASLSADVTSVAPANGFRPWNSQEPAGYRPAYRPGWQSRTPAAREPVQKPAWQRTATPSRFGPQARPAPEPEEMPMQPAQEPQKPALDNAPRLDGYRLGYRAAPQRQPYPGRNEYGNQGYNGGYQNRPAYQQSGYPNRSGYQQQSNYGQQNGYRPTGSYQPRSYAPLQSAEQNFNDGVYRLGRDVHFSEQAEAGQLPELLQTIPSEPASGILEVLPDGYGFLRSKSLLPGKQDIYVSMAQVRRFGLRTGDNVEGQARQQRESDKYAALLYVEKVNGEPAKENPERLGFDQLVPVYPTRRIALEDPNGKNSMIIRLVDLIAPMGFGQRAMIAAPPESSRLLLMRELCRAIKRNDPNAVVMMLLIDVAPEDVTEISESVEAEVFASTFADAPETQTRVSETMLERAQRMVENGSNVVILLDSLTKLTRAYQATLAQGSRPMTNTVTPAALVKPKRFFGTARNTRDAGSLTMIATIATETGSRVDEIIFEEFRGTANMELVLCAEEPGDPIQPMINLQLSGTKKDDMLLTADEKEGLRSIRRVLGAATNGEAVVQLVDMMQKTKCNADLLKRLQDWIALWEKSGFLGSTG